MTPEEELRAAIDLLRHPTQAEAPPLFTRISRTFIEPRAHTRRAMDPGVARELAKWLESQLVLLQSDNYPASHGYALDVARAILRSQL